MNRRAEGRGPLPLPMSGVLVRNPEGYTVSTLSSTTDTLLRAGGAGLLYDPRGTPDDGDARVVHALCRGFSVPFLVVDDVQLARRQRADGIYLSTASADVAAASAQLPWGVVGVFCGLDVEAAGRATDQGAAYVAFGYTDAQPQAAADSAAELGKVVAQARERIRKPIIAAGDLTPAVAADILRHGADLLALSGVVYGAEHPRRVLLEYLGSFPARDVFRARGGEAGR